MIVPPGVAGFDGLAGLDEVDPGLPGFEAVVAELEAVVRARAAMTAPTTKDTSFLDMTNVLLRAMGLVGCYVWHRCGPDA
jgi:hypothetical protein